MCSKIFGLLLFSTIILASKYEKEIKSINTFATASTAKYYLVKKDLKRKLEKTEKICCDKKFTDISDMIIWNQFLNRPYHLNTNEDYLTRNDIIIYIESPKETLFSIIRSKESPYTWEIHYNPTTIDLDEGIGQKSLDVRKITLNVMELYEKPQFLINSRKYVEEIQLLNIKCISIEDNILKMCLIAGNLENKYHSLLKKNEIEEHSISHELLNILTFLLTNKSLFLLPSFVGKRFSIHEMSFNKTKVVDKIDKIKNKSKEFSSFHRKKNLDSLDEIRGQLDLIEKNFIDLEIFSDKFEKGINKYQRHNTLIFSDLFDIKESDLVSLFNDFYDVFESYKPIVYLKEKETMLLFKSKKVNVENFHQTFKSRYESIWFIEVFTKLQEDPNTTNIDKALLYQTPMSKNIVDENLYYDIKNEFDDFIKEKIRMKTSQKNIKKLEDEKYILILYNKCLTIYCSELNNKKYSTILNVEYKDELYKKLQCDVLNELNDIDRLLKIENSKSIIGLSTKSKEPEKSSRNIFKKLNDLRTKKSSQLEPPSFEKPISPTLEELNDPERITSSDSETRSSRETKETSEINSSLSTEDEESIQELSTTSFTEDISESNKSNIINEKEYNNLTSWRTYNLILISLLVIIIASIVFLLVRLLRPQIQ